MKQLLLIGLFLYAGVAWAQPPFELTPNGFAPVTFTVPARDMLDRADRITRWAAKENRKGHDVVRESDQSLRVEARRDNAFFYRDRGEEYAFRIDYVMTIGFTDDTCTVTFSVSDIYGKGRPVQMQLSDYFLSDGRLKEDFRDVKPSLERTANALLRSLYDALQRP